MWTWSVASATACPPGEVEIVKAGESKHGVVDAVALEAAFAEDSPGLHAGEDVLDAGADPFWDLLWACFQSDSSSPLRRRSITSPVPE